MNCADGKGSPLLSVAQRQWYRKQAFEQLAADLAALAKIAASDPEFVIPELRRWLGDRYFASVRPPKTADLPPDERKGWEEFWARVKSLTDSPALPEGSERP
jgi:hypothetical protein